MDYLNRAGRVDAFCHGSPGSEWMLGFERRWKGELARRVAQPLPASRAFACYKNVVNDFFMKLSEAFIRLQLNNKPENIFNVDETGFQTDIGNQKMFCKRGVRNLVPPTGNAVK